MSNLERRRRLHAIRAAGASFAQAGGLLGFSKQAAHSLIQRDPDSRAIRNYIAQLLRYASPRSPGWYGGDMRGTLKIEFAMELPSVANMYGEHRMAKARRVKMQRRAVAQAWAIQRGYGKWAYWPATITLTRISSRDLDDDNLSSAFKAVRDEITRCMGLTDDRDPRLTWVTRQERGAPKQQAIRIEVEGGVDDEP